MKKPEEFQRCAERLKVLADPERLRLLILLLDGPRYVGSLAEELQHSIVKVSHHLGVLRQSGMVCSTRQGRNIQYSAAPDVFAVADSTNTANYLDLGCCRLELTMSPGQKRG
ncbi:MAG: helix-turn-helix transcriptional regulator [Planctomycetaceae bacterium]|nr:helix-turn-helix transcriptional regulator [Planctomycetaceae bacterium]